MRRFFILAKKLFLFTVIFALLAGNICLSEEIKLTTIRSSPPRIVRGKIEVSAGGVPEITGGNGFTVTKQEVGEYKITFDEPFSAGPVPPPTVVCTYFPTDKTSPPMQTHPWSHVMSVNNQEAVVTTITAGGGNDPSVAKYRTDVGGISFIVVGTR